MAGYVARSETIGSTKLELVEDGRGSCSETAESWYEIHVNNEVVSSWSGGILADLAYFWHWWRLRRAHAREVTKGQK